MSIRDSGFGLNYNKGFGSGKTFMAKPQDNSQGWDLLTQRRQHEFTGGQNDANRGLQRYLGDQGDATQRYGIDQTAATNREGNRLSYQASILPHNLKQGRFNAVFPLFQNALGGLQGAAGGGGGYSGGGAFGQQPNIDAGPVFSPGQVQQQVNAARSGNDAASAGRTRQMSTQLAGRGFGSGSPLAMALEQNLFGQNLAANAGNERDIRMGATQGNADHVLKAQQAREGQFAARQQEEIERGKSYIGGMSSLLGSFGSMIG